MKILDITSSLSSLPDWLEWVLCAVGHVIPGLSGVVCWCLFNSTKRTRGLISGYILKSSIRAP